MTTLREAAQFALDALHCPGDSELRDRVEAKLRAALAEPDDDTLTAAYMMGRYDAKKAEPQKPYCYTYTGGDGEEYFAPPSGYRPDHAKPLYAAPQPRKRLTREQAMRIVEQNPDTMMAIRMTEAAHGIEAAVWGEKT